MNDLINIATATFGIIVILLAIIISIYVIIKAIQLERETRRMN